MTKIQKVLIFILLYCGWVGAAGYAVFGLCTACLDPGPLQLASIGGYLVIIMLPVWLFIRWWNAVPGWMKKVEADGQQAKATILSVKNTGVVINNTVAVVKLNLRVEPPNEAAFEVSQEKEISMLTGLGGYSAGARVTVKYDPDHKDHIILLGDPDSMPDDRDESRHATAEVSGSGSTVTEKLEELSKLHKSGELSDSEFAAAKKKVLG